MQHPEISHGAIRIGFTPDEEVGGGTTHFDVKKFGAFCGYTMDGSSRGELETETFSADAMIVTFQGVNTHPGFAKGKMANSIKVAADFIDRLPKDRMSPETTAGREGSSIPTWSMRRSIRPPWLPDSRLRNPGLPERRSSRSARAGDRDLVPGVTATFKVENSYRAT